MLKQRNEPERKEKSQTEGYNKAQPVEERFARIFAIIGSVCGLVAAWANFEHRFTTFKVAIISGVCSFILSICLHWLPSKKPNKDAGLLELPSIPFEPQTELEPEPKNVPVLDEIENQLLMILWIAKEDSPLCGEHALVQKIRHILHKQNKPPLYKAMLDHHLGSLCKRGYVAVSYERGWVEVEFSLTAKGTSYIIERNLLAADWLHYLI